MRPRNVLQCLQGACWRKRECGVGRQRAQGPRKGKGERPARSRSVLSAASGDGLDLTASAASVRPPSLASSPPLPPNPVPNSLPAPTRRLTASPAAAPSSAPHTRPTGGSRHLRARVPAPPPYTGPT